MIDESKLEFIVLKKSELDKNTDNQIYDIEQSLIDDEKRWVVSAGKFNYLKDLDSILCYSICKYEGEVVGSARFYKKYFYAESDALDGYFVGINDVYVKPGFRRLGIAFKILMNGINYWKKKEPKIKFRLGVYYENKDALGLYKKLGFKPHDVTMIKTFGKKINTKSVIDVTINKPIYSLFKRINFSSNINLYHLSSKKLTNLHLYPRVPDYVEMLGTLMNEDKVTPRISFASSILGCLRGMPDGIDEWKDFRKSVGKIYYVYKLINPEERYIYKPNSSEVPDVDYFNEVWYKKDCYLKYLGKIKVTKIIELSTERDNGFGEGKKIKERDCEYQWISKST